MNFTMNRKTLALILATVATACSVIGFIGRGNDFLGIFAVIGLFLSIASYIIGGGLGDAIKAALTLGKWGWLIVPFPIDIATGLFTMLVSFVAFLFLPIIFVGKRCLSSNR